MRLVGSLGGVGRSGIVYVLRTPGRSCQCGVVEQAEAGRRAEEWYGKLLTMYHGRWESRVWFSNGAAVGRAQGRQLVCPGELSR